MYASELSLSYLYASELSHHVNLKTFINKKNIGNINDKNKIVHLAGITNFQYNYFSGESISLNWQEPASLAS